MNPIISVIMPVFNGEKYVSDAIHSILNQSFKNFEFIIIDDSSSDKTPEILNSYKDARIQIHSNEKNLKIAHTLNKGISLARGKYIARMDADDIAHPERLKKQLQIIETRPDIGLVGSGVELFGAINRTKLRPETPEQNKIRLMFQSCCTHPAIMFEKSLVMDHNIKYLDEYVPTEDYMFIFELSKYTNIYNIQEVLLKYRTFPPKITFQKYENKRLNLGRSIRKRIFQYYRFNFTPRQFELHSILSQRESIDEIHQLNDLLKYTEELSQVLHNNFDSELIVSELKFQWMAFLKKNMSLKVIYWYLKNISHPFISPNLGLIKQFYNRNL